MPGVDSVQISLCDALQVNGKPLQEEQLWSVLCQSTETIQDVFLKGQALADDGPSFVVSPYTLLLCADGKVMFTESIDTSVPDLRNYIPPEGLAGINHFSELVVEKMYIYALGQTLRWCSDYKSFSLPGPLSHNLLSLVSSMCSHSPEQRISLVHILEACALHTQSKTNAVPYAEHIARLNKIILGSVDELDRIGQDEDQIYANANGNNNARMDDRSYFQKDSYQRSPPDMDRQPAQNRSPQKRPHSFQGRSYRRGDDAPDFVENSLRRLPQARDVSHYSGSTADSHESMERLHPRKRSNLEESYLSDEDDEGRSYHLSDIVSSPNMSPSRVSKKSYQSLPRHRERSRSPARWDRPTSRPSQVYERLRERREKLSLLREQLGIRQPNPPPAFPVYQSESDAAQSDIEDIKRNIRELRRRGRSHKSLLSVESTQEGSYHPGRLTPASSLPSIPNALYEERYYDHHSRLHSPPRSQGADPYFSDDYRRRGHNRSRHRNGDFDNRRPPRQTAKKLKKLFGPEFVIMSSAPNETIDMVPSMMCKMGKVPPERKQVVVVLLNGKCIDLMCDLGTSGQELFDMVAAHLQLSERFYFGLAFIKDGEYMFLDPDSKIYKVGPDSWRAEMKKGTLRSTISRDKLTLFFRVKFYADSVNVLKNLDHIARHNFYLQLRRDILEERVKCTEGEAMQLASLALQAEMGEYDHERMAQNYFLPEHYVPAETIESMGVSSIRRKLPILHQGHEDMTEEESEFEYLMEARKLSEYGIHFHKVSKSKKSPKQSVWLGICARGIIVYDKSGSQRSQIHAHPWPATKKVAFKKKKFVVEPNDSSGFKFVHYTDNYKKGKYLLQLCKAQHRFHMTMRTKQQIAQRFHEEFPSPMKYNTPVRQSDFGYDVHFSDDDDEELIVEDYADDYNYPPNNREPYPVASEPALNMLEDPYSQHPRAQSHMERRGRGETLPDNSRGRSLRGRRSHLSKARSVDTGRQLLDDGDDPLLGRERPLSSQARSRNRNYESYSEDNFSSQEDIHGNERDEPDWRNIVSEQYLRPMRPADGEDEEIEEGPYATIDSIRERKSESVKQNYRKNSPSRPQRGTNHPYVVDTSIHTRGDPYQRNASPQQSLASPLSETLQDRLDEMPTPEAPERDIVIVTLKKDSHMGLGLTIIGGENSGSLDLGIFVQEVMADGPADRDGRIFPGDRIISINGQSLEGVGHKVAVDVIQRTPEVVQLILSQPRRKQISPEHKLIEGNALPEAPYANIAELRRHSTGGHPKIPPDRRPQRSASAVSASESISKQTPPTKPRRKPQTFGSSYSLVNSDSEAGMSETEQRKPERPSGNGEQQTANRDRKPPAVSQTTQESKKDANISSKNALKNIDHEVKDRETKSTQQNSSKNVPTMDRQPSHEKSLRDDTIRGFSPTLDMDFDDNFSDDVPTPESSELEDLFGDEEEKKKKPEINLRKSMNMSPSLSVDEKMDAQNNVGDSDTKKRQTDSKTGGKGADEELVVSALQPGDVFTVQLTKKNGSLGISVTGGINTSVKHGGIYVKTMVPGGAAEEEGQIQPGDRVLQVDKYSLKNVTHKQAVEILRKVPEESVLQMERGNPPARTNTLPPTPVNFKEASEELVEGTVDAVTEEQLNHQPMKGIMNEGETPISNEEEILNENTLRFSPPPGEADIQDNKPSGDLPSSQMDSLRATEQSPGTTTPTIEALNDENENTTDDEDEEGSQTEDEEQSEEDESDADSEDEEATESDIPSDDFPEDDELYAEIASPALSTREADTLTPTAHLMMTPTRGLFGMRNQGNVRGQQNWVYRKSIDDDDRYSSAVSESTNARSPSPTSSYHPEDEGNFRSGFQAFRRPNENQNGDANSSSFRRVIRSPFDGGRKALEIEPSILPVMMEEEPAELEGVSTANSVDNIVQGSMKSKPQSPSKDESKEKLDLSEEPESLLHHPEAIDQSSYQPTMVTMDSNLMSPMSTLDSVGALNLTQTLLADPDATSDVKLPDVPYVTLDNCFEIELMKGEQGLGLSVQGGVGAHLDPRFCTVRIKKIFPGQAAAKSGLVEEGDIILAVNGEHVHNAVHSEVVAKLRNSSQTVRLLICRPSQEELNTLLQQDNEKKKQPSVKDNLGARKEVQPLPTIPGANMSGVNQTSPISSPVLSPAADKSEVTSHNSSVEFGSSELLSLSESSPRQKVQEDNDATEVTLVKPVRGGLGFTVAGGVNTGGCYIKDIITDPALSDGRLMKGDKIISVNGKDMTKMNHFEAVTFLRMTPREVTLKVKRPVNRYDLASPSPEKQFPASAPKSDSQASVIPPRNDGDEDGDSEDNELLRMDEIERLTPKTVATKNKVQEDENEVLRNQLEGHPVITLRCKKREDAGIKLTSDSMGQKPLIRVSLIQRGSPAHREGSIQVNDEVKSINGHLIDNQRLAEAQELLSENGEVLQLQLSRNGLPVHPTSKDVPGPNVTASNSVNDNHLQQEGLNGEKPKQDDSDIDLGDVSAEESWEDMSSEKSSEEDLDAILAALNPLHSARGGSAKNDIKIIKAVGDPPANDTKFPVKTSESPPPVPEAPLPPLTPTSEHSSTPTLEHSPTPEHSPVPSQLPNPSEDLVKTTEEVSGLNEKVLANPQNDILNTSLEEGEEERRRAEEKRREEDKQNSDLRRLDEDEVEQSVLNDIMNQEDSIDDITFADMLSSGDDYDEETDEAQSEEDEDDLKHKQESNQQQSEEDLKLDDKDAVKRNVKSQKPMSSDLLFKDIAQLSASDGMSVIAPSPVVVNPPPQRVSPPPQDLTVSTSDDESSLSLALPSIEEDQPPPFKVAPLSQQSVKQEKLEGPSQEQIVTGNEPVPTLNDSPVASPGSVNSDFSFGDSLPIPSSPSENGSIREDVERPSRVAKSADKDGQVANTKPGPSEADQQEDDSENKDIEGDSSARQQLLSSSPLSPESKLPSMETSPRDASFGRNHETLSQEISGRDSKPLQKQSEEKRDVGSLKVTSDTVTPKSNLEVENRIAPEDRDSVVPSRMVTPLRRPPSTISEGLSASEGGVYWVELAKPATGGLGLSLVGAERGGKTSVFVKTVTPGGVTDLDGRIKVGDKMLQVNGQSTVGMTQKKVISLLRKAQGTVKLALSSGKPPSRPSSFVAMDSCTDTDREPPPTVPPLDLPRDTMVSDSDRERTSTKQVEEKEDGSDLSSLASSTDDGKDVQSEMKADRRLQQNDPLITTVTYESSLLHTLSIENLSSFSMLTPPPPEFDVSVSSDHDTDSDIDSTAELPNDSLLDLLDDSGNAVAMETALRATRQIGKVLKDKIQGKEDISFGSDIGFPLSSENSSPLPSEGEQSERSPTDRSDVGRTSVLTERELTAMKILQVPSGCKLYSGKSLQSIISGLQKQIDKHDPEEEFKMLRQVKAADACEVARKPENRDKNRFRNVLPYDKTRVVLQTSDTDYVNASHIQVKVASSEYHYIACQGPLPQTTKDFWAMVWEQGVEVIAMVTLDYENGKVKCHKYWPEKKDSVMKIHHFEIKLEEVSKLDHFHIRHLTMTHTESKVSHHVTHLNFTSWPDHSVPDSALPLLRYTRYMRKIGGEFNPVIVHCSAGIGRTGTLMTIDIVLNMIEADQEFKIEEIVKGLRLQRQGMIQTKDQYLFCYKAVIDALKML